jgi:nicotinamide-nucleotide amidase
LLTDKIIQDVATKLVSTLKTKGLTVATAESCTGGLVASAITDVPGASEVLLMGVVSYTRMAKLKVLGVKAETYDNLTAYSAEVADEMARGIAKLSGADIVISTTGLAGPGGGTPEKPVGLVYIATGPLTDLKIRRWDFTGNRSDIRRQAVYEALNGALAAAENIQK